MQVSHAADDFAAIARRLKELQEENQFAEKRILEEAQPRVWLGYPVSRASNQRGETSRSTLR
jgi:hypothetical protein